MFCVTQGDSVLLLDRVCLLPCLLPFPARYQVADTHASSCDPLRKPGTDSQHGGIFQIQQRRQIRRWSKDTEASLTPRLPPPTPLYHWHAWVCGVFTYGRLRVCGQLVFVCVYIHRAVDWGRWRQRRGRFQKLSFPLLSVLAFISCPFMFHCRVSGRLFSCHIEGKTDRGAENEVCRTWLCSLAGRLY